jgi:hypothetical protein
MTCVQTQYSVPLQLYLEIQTKLTFHLDSPSRTHTPVLHLRKGSYIQPLQLIFITHTHTHAFHASSSS